MNMPPRLTVVGTQERPDHWYLPADAQCFFWGEYTPYEHTQGKRWNFSATNQLIANFKKGVDRRDRPDWHYKQQAIRQVATAFSRFWKWAEIHQNHRLALIPIPPSKPRRDPLYDTRMVDMLNQLAQLVDLPLDIRDCLSFSGAHAASHEAAERPSPDELHADLRLDEAAGRRVQPPTVVFLFDDMLTTGAHYVATARKLTEAYPGVQIIGNFVARRLISNPFEDANIVLDLVIPR